MSRVLLSVGDASGDTVAAEFARALLERLPGTCLVGLGGPEMARAGVKLVAEQRELAVGGLFEAIPSLPRVVRVWRRMLASLRAERPDLAVLVDSSAFNLPLARRIRRAGVPVLYYVAPQVWAWRPGRIAKLARRVDRVALILPFEPALYEPTAVRFDFVGHPLVDRLSGASSGLDRASARAKLGLPPDATLVALLPASRRNEVRHGLPVFLETARVLHARDPRIHFVLPVAASLERRDIEAAIASAALPSLLRIDCVEGHSVEALWACDAVLAKPGTVTLEAALLDRPLVVATRGHPWTAALLRRIVRVHWLAMPNLIADEEIVPELLQDDAVPERIAEAVLAHLDGPEREHQLEGFAEVRRRLGEPGASQRAAAIAEEMILAGRRA
jgi:lipid-A-disaccharide synthase